MSDSSSRDDENTQHDVGEYALSNEAAAFLPQRYCSWCLCENPEIQLQRESGVLTCDVCSHPQLCACVDLSHYDPFFSGHANDPLNVFPDGLFAIRLAGITMHYVLEESYDPMDYIRLLRMISSTLKMWDGCFMTAELATHLDHFPYLEKPVTEYLCLAEKCDVDTRPERIQGVSKYLTDRARKWLQDELDYFEAWFHKEEWQVRWNRYKSVHACDCRLHSPFTTKCLICGENKHPAQFLHDDGFDMIRCLSCVMPACSHCGNKTWAFKLWKTNDPALLAYTRHPLCKECAKFSKLRKQNHQADLRVE